MLHEKKICFNIYTPEKFHFFLNFAAWQWYILEKFYCYVPHGWSKARDTSRKIEINAHLSFRGSFKQIIRFSPRIGSIFDPYRLGVLHHCTDRNGCDSDSFPCSSTVAHSKHKRRKLLSRLPRSKHIYLGSKNFVERRARSLGFSQLTAW